METRVVTQRNASAYRDGEGPHDWQTYDGLEFFCSTECGAKMYGWSSYPANDRNDNKYMTGYGDSRGTGSCPNNHEDDVIYRTAKQIEEEKNEQTS